MSAKAHILQGLRLSLTTSLVAVGCCLAFAAAAQPAYYSYPVEPGLDASEPPVAAQAPATPPVTGLQVIESPAQDKLAGRPSPYIQPKTAALPAPSGSEALSDSELAAAPTPVERKKLTQIAAQATAPQQPVPIVASAPPSPPPVIAAAAPLPRPAPQVAASSSSPGSGFRIPDSHTLPAPQRVAVQAPAGPTPAELQAQLVAARAANAEKTRAMLADASAGAARGLNAASAVPGHVFAAGGDDGHAYATAHLELASMVQVSQTSTASVATLAAAKGAQQLALNDDSKALSALTPAAGAASSPVPGGDLNAPPPIPTMTAPPSLPATATDLPPPNTLKDMPAPPPLPVPPEEEPKHLSQQSKTIADSLPPEKPKRAHVNEHVNIEHVSKNPLDNEEVRQHEGVGISISVRKPKANVTQMLDDAYAALVAGNQEDAVALYKEVLSNDPNNRLALFGLATTYHRAGQLQLARPLYGKLLAIDPQNEEGLDNFLVLLSDESPKDALVEMKKLEKTHPDFSPLKAQEAVIYEKQGDYDKAVTTMKQAIEMSPENLKYRYDMAIIFDRKGDWGNASFFYQQLITASERGDKIPAKAEEIQERLTFIRSNNPQTKTVQTVYAGHDGNAADAGPEPDGTARVEVK